MHKITQKPFTVCILYTFDLQNDTTFVPDAVTW